MKKLPKVLLGASALVLVAGLAFAQGLAIVTSLNATDIIPLASGTVSTGIQVSDLATAIKASGSGPVVTTSVSAPTTTTLLLGGATTTTAGLQVAQGAAGVNDVIVTDGATGTVPSIASGGAGADANIGLQINASGTGTIRLGGTTTTAGLQIAQTATAVNDIILTNGATGAAPSLVTGGAGVDANVGMVIAGNGTGAILIGGTTTTLAGLQVAAPASRVNDVIVTPSATSGITTITAGGAGADANAVLAVASNGTGSLLLGGATTTVAGLQVAQVAATVNDVIVTPSATGVVPSIALGGAGADANRDMNVTAKGAGIVTLGGARTTCSGTTTSACAGQRFTSSVTGLSTAAGGVSATAMTVTNANVVAATTLVMCQVNGYSGTGQPVATNVTPGVGTVSFQITNVASSGSLNATVPVACVVF